MGRLQYSKTIRTGLSHFEMMVLNSFPYYGCRSQISSKTIIPVICALSTQNRCNLTDKYGNVVCKA